MSLGCQIWSDLVDKFAKLYDALVENRSNSSWQIFMTKFTNATSILTHFKCFHNLKSISRPLKSKEFKALYR